MAERSADRQTVPPAHVVGARALPVPLASRRHRALPRPERRQARPWGWAGGRYRGNHRDTSALIDTNVIVFDIDGGGDVGRIASFFAEYRKVVHSTLKSTPAAPRCRVVLQLKSACAAPLTYKRAHKVVQEKLKGAGFDVDAGASEAVRFNFLLMHQPGLELRFVETDGELFDSS